MNMLEQTGRIYINFNILSVEHIKSSTYKFMHHKNIGMKEN